MYKTYSCDFILQLTSPYVCSIILYFMFYIYINDEKCKKRYVNISIIHGIILCSINVDLDGVSRRQHNRDAIVKKMV